METERCPTGTCPKEDCRCGGKYPRQPVDPNTRTVPEALPKSTQAVPFSIKGGLTK